MLSPKVISFPAASFIARLNDRCSPVGEGPANRVGGSLVLLIGHDVIDLKLTVDARLATDCEDGPWLQLPVELNDGKASRLLVGLLGYPLNRTQPDR